ncbi:hypothetical protein GLOIN_2v1574866 [Rhizophagus irregularis DAOM 181602=DAOM 197198]|uniref:Uncharacterized protein n=1 Tax=Rhizophagus irregularis (strain DAOM 181602 / DAOM 197198 / MUCL 43194) TaxID=747089 RepID=A0A2P4QA78_RHIID|nr:hypothetical protein GLOIN_2v1574866 [Rhizophagus irregularis DAOM 181602=DAOM 197198]POG74549.1 hypothetical protein GLOIN_2v1574866 [Rhizophagus irregularis DAOM 181602=DAOM 197198]|eukprot:XP_025181415.1 hypothetical protein GLOIN_2v1574866 [Rhizophagus irregularis DAOM 181602=DAOM 197198]
MRNSKGLFKRLSSKDYFKKYFYLRVSSFVCNCIFIFYFHSNNKLRHRDNKRR